METVGALWRDCESTVEGVSDPDQRGRVSGKTQGCVGQDTRELERICARTLER